MNFTNILLAGEGRERKLFLSSWMGLSSHNDLDYAKTSFSRSIILSKGKECNICLFFHESEDRNSFDFSTNIDQSIRESQVVIFLQFYNNIFMNNICIWSYASHDIDQLPF